jgi:hypothetical protein
MNITPEQQKLLRLGGLALFFIANAVLSLTGGSLDSPVPQYKPILSDGCRNYLYEHTEFDIPPLNCEEELRYLLRRINATLRDIRDARNNSNLDVPTDNSTP